MNWDAVGAVAELIGAVGVIVSLVYLALQIRQNSSLLKQSTAAERANAAVISAGHGAELMQALALDREVARVWVVGTSRPEELTEDELAQFDLLMVAQLIRVDVNLFLASAGPLDAQVGEIWERILDDWIRHPRFRQRWQEGWLARFMTTSFRERVRHKMERPPKEDG